jgi:hypothetical protein
MVLGLEIEYRRLADLFQLEVVLLGLAIRDLVVNAVRKWHPDRLEAVIELVGVGQTLFDIGSQLRSSADRLVSCLSLEVGNLTPEGLLLRPEVLGFGSHAASFLIEDNQLIEVDVGNRSPLEKTANIIRMIT